MTRILAGVLASMTLATTASAGPVSHAQLLAGVETYREIQGFNHVIDSQRFVGYFRRSGDACKVVVMIAGSDDPSLEIPVRRLELSIPAADRAEVPADAGKALGIGCTVDADAIKLVTLVPMSMRTAGR